jgi:hypothetical protein
MSSLRMVGMVVGLLILVTGCGPLIVGPSSPRPDVRVPAGSAPGALVLDPSIRDAFVILDTGAVGEVNVTGWRTTLEAGFHNAFPGNGAAGGARLELLKADLAFVPAILVVNHAGKPLGSKTIRARVHFRARLVSPSGEELGALEGNVAPRESAATFSGVTDNASKSVEVLYEALAAKLLTLPAHARRE